MEKMRITGACASRCAAPLIAVVALFCLCPLSSRAVDVEVHDEVSGSTPSYIGANEGGQFSIEFMVDCGINAYRLFAGMNRTEPQDDDGSYGSPTIAEIKANPDIINWNTWDSVLNNASYWWYEPAFAGYVEDLRVHGIEPVICLRNKEGVNPSWAPPQNNWDDADWNEWWEYCFAIAYWCNVRNGFGITRFEVHNEPDYLTQDWTGTQAQYIELVEKASDAVRFANNIAGISAYVHAPVVANYTSSYVHNVLSSADSSVDVLDYHTYATDIAPSVQHIRGDVQTYNTDGILEPVWVSEWGIYSGSYDTLTRGVTTCRQLYDFTIEGVEGLCIFPFFDWGGFYGLVSSGGAKTETYYAYRLMLKGLCGGKDILGTSSSNGSKKVMVTRDGNNIYVIAVDAGETVSVDLSAIAVDSGRYAVYEYSSARKDAVSASGSFSSGSISFSAPASGAACAVIYPDEPLDYFAVSAWMPTSWDAANALASFQNNLDVLTEISPFWYEMTSTGALNTYAGARDASIVNTAHANGMLVLPTITNNFDGSRVSAVINDRDKTITHIQNIMSEVTTYNYDGIDIDYESMDSSDRDAFSAFIRRLSNALHAQGKILTIAVQAKTSAPGGSWGPGSQDWYRLGQYVDRFRIMTYDYHWSTSGPGAIAPVGWLDDVLSFAGTVMDKAKTNMGVPFYGYDWWVGKSGSDVTWLAVQDLIGTYSPSIQWDGTAKEPWFQYTMPGNKLHEVWYQNSDSIGHKLDAAMTRQVGGIAIWRLGSEDPDNWDVIRNDDFDSDGLTLSQENGYGTDPTAADTDGGGTNDAVEITDGTDPVVSSDDLDGDWDGDGLSSRDENTYETDPDDEDSDDDGLSDSEEVNYNDSDGGYYPYPTGTDTNANSADTDGDSFSDYIEAECGGDPLASGVVPDVIRVNFQPLASSVPSTYCRDRGAGYGPCGYGWR